MALENLSKKSTQTETNFCQLVRMILPALAGLKIRD